MHRYTWCVVMAVLFMATGLNTSLAEETEGAETVEAMPAEDEAVEEMTVEQRLEKMERIVRRLEHMIPYYYHGDPLDRLERRIRDLESKVEQVERQQRRMEDEIRRLQTRR